MRKRSREQRVGGERGRGEELAIGVGLRGARRMTVRAKTTRTIRLMTILQL